MSVRKGQGWTPLLDTRGLQALRRHCITHRHDSVIDITKWAQEYFQKPLSVNSIRHAICRCQPKLYHAKKEAICEHGPEAPSCPVGSFKMDGFKVEKCSMVRRVQISHSCYLSMSMLKIVNLCKLCLKYWQMHRRQCTNVSTQFYKFKYCMYCI